MRLTRDATTLICRARGDYVHEDETDYDETRAANQIFVCLSCDVGDSLWWWRTGDTY